MTKSNNSTRFLLWEIEPNFSFGFFIATAIISTIFWAIWRLFPTFYPEHSIFMIIHHFLAIFTLICMFIATLASPGRPSKSPIKELQRMDEIIEEIENTQSNECIVEIGIMFLP